MPLLGLCRLEFLGDPCWGEFGSYHLIRRPVHTKQKRVNSEFRVSALVQVSTVPREALM